MREKQLLARVGEVLAQVRVDGDSFALQLGLHDLRDQGCTTATRGCGSRRLLDGADGCAPALDSGANGTFAHIVA